ncbi:hypothetical protein GWK47_010243 [Chionoecetes opilio]|uniref:Uncharacterized protein n=1 Tax=Chionoecetes opilio TaxID=41210 RepID=A0A8J5CQG9_CHIOP|nr:hypothetical protein GWK47_010243 [Chionoecetes opilio]
MTCAEIQLKNGLLMGVRDEELINALSPSTQALLFKTGSPVAVPSKSPAIHPPLFTRLQASFAPCPTYRKGRPHDKTPHSPQLPPSGQRVKTQHRTGVSQPCSPCQSCARRHGPKCPGPGMRLCYNLRPSRSLGGD